MAFKSFSVIGLLTFTIGLSLPCFAAQTGSIKPHTPVPVKHAVGKSLHKAAHTSHRKIAYTGSHYLVPPPPPYTPSMLPELEYARYSQYYSQAAPASAEEGSPYSKYIYTRSGYESPKPVQPNKYVTYWANKT